MNIFFAAHLLAMLATFIIVLAYVGGRHGWPLGLLSALGGLFILAIVWELIAHLLRRIRPKFRASHHEGEPQEADGGEVIGFWGGREL
jgi:hypothetical protein